MESEEWRVKSEDLDYFSNFIAEGDTITPHSTLHTPNSISAVVFQSFCNLNDSGGAQPVGTQLDEFFSVLQ